MTRPESIARIDAITAAETIKKTPLLSPREKFWVTLGSIAALAGAYGFLQTDYAQQESLNDTLTADAADSIPGFQELTGDVKSIWIFDNMKSTGVKLEDGTTCDIQYTTFGDGLFDELFSNEARIVGYGTCPNPSDALSE